MATAIALAIVYAAIFAVYGLWAYARIAAGALAWPYLVALPFVWLLVPLTFVMLWFALAWWYRAKRPRAHRLRPGRTAHLVWREFVTIAGNAPRMIGFRWLMRDPPPAPASHPILLLHGVLCNAGVWHPFRRYCDARGIGPVYALSYGPPLASIDIFAEQLRVRIDEILAATGAPSVTILAHSMGGLVARAYLRRYGGGKVRRLITVGTPHEGSVHAWMFPGVSLAQMRPGNAWLGALGPPGGNDVPTIVSLWSWHDSMVAPQTSSRIEFGANVEIAGVGHNALLTDPGVWRRLAEEIGRS